LIKIWWNCKGDPLRFHQILIKFEEKLKDFIRSLPNLQKIDYILVKTWWNRKGVTFTISSNLKKIHQFLIKFGENRKWLSRILIKPTLSLFPTKHANFETKTFLNLFYCAEFGFPKLVPNMLAFSVSLQ